MLNRSRSVRIICVVFSVAAVSVAMRIRQHAPLIQHREPASDSASLNAPAETQTSSEASIQKKINRPLDPRSARREAVDYMQLVQQLIPIAEEGSTEAQYEIASALHYCEENWHARSFFSSVTGKWRTPEQLQRLYVMLPENTRSLMQEADEHCHAFVDELDILKTSDKWLEQATEAGFPAAVFLKADLMFKANLKTEDYEQMAQAKKMAISASTTGDPTVLFGMADFVSSAQDKERVQKLISAWWLVGCQSGYDCGPESEAIRSNCTVDPQCANKPSIVEQLQRINGAKFGEIEELAREIKTAVASQDTNAIAKFL